MKIRQCWLGNCPYVVVYHIGGQMVIKRFSTSAVSKKGYGYGEYACAKFLAENSQYVDNIKLNINKTHWKDDGEFDWLYIQEL